ncbi:alpha-2-HS-glycoprotein [Spea bombifrons]|uniref:alpha-2-HS-glycoprotein n=1 Tax=Spea bombifrons TaxID=233779 RepID=UPI00234B40EC|nr:alpha-2-HS-glycoprotein [Spea bombifrons]
MLLWVSSFLAQLLICSAFVVSLQPVGRIVNLDDPEAHEAASVALENINRNHVHGYKYALDRIEKINVYPQGPGQEIFSLEIDLLETTCPSVSPTPVERCAVRPVVNHRVKGDCDVKLKKENGNFTVIGVRCKSEPDSAENIFEICPICSLLAPMNDTQVIHAVEVLLGKFNSGNITGFYHLHEIGRAQVQAAPVNKISVEFIVAASNCSKEDASSSESVCVVQTGAGSHYGACVGSYSQTQGVENEDLVQCTIYDPQPQEAVDQKVPPAPQQPVVVQPHFHHNLHHANVGHYSSESNSAEHPQGVHVSHAV